MPAIGPKYFLVLVDLLQTGSKASTASETVGRQCHEYVQLESTVIDMNLSNLYSKVREGKVLHVVDFVAVSA